jgi:hypothetical protein
MYEPKGSCHSQSQHPRQPSFRPTSNNVNGIKFTGDTTTSHDVDFDFDFDLCCAVPQVVTAGLQNLVTAVANVGKAIRFQSVKVTGLVEAATGISMSARLTDECSTCKDTVENRLEG